MIAQLRGKLLEKDPQHCVIDVGGVGYRALVPVSTYCQLSEVGQDAHLLIHTHVREDALLLFGFASRQELTLFERLILVSGIGPKLAVSILSGIDATDLANALKNSDLARLTRIPGVGRKTAERLILELKDKVAALAPEAGAQPPTARDSREDLLSALLNLGYPRPDAERGVERAMRDHAGGRFEELLREALHVLSRR